MPTQTIAQIQREIAKLQAKAKAIETASNSKKLKAVQKVRQLMNKLGVTVADLGGNEPVAKTAGTKAKTESGRKNAAKKTARKSRVSRPVPIRYRDNETGNTWTGRGRPPVWLAERMQQGKTKEDYLIPVSAVAAADQTPGEPAAS